MFDENTFIETLAKMFNTDADKISGETLLREDLGATSQMFFGVSALLEKMSGKRASYADVNACKTVGDVIALVS